MKCVDKNATAFFGLVVLVLAGGCSAPDPSLLPEETRPKPHLAVVVAQADLPILGETELTATLTGVEPRQGALLSFTGDNVEPESPTGRTDAAGKVSLRLKATVRSLPGSASVTVAYGEEATAQATLAVVEADLRLGHLGAGGEFVEGEMLVSPRRLASNGVAEFRLAVADADGVLVEEALAVRFDSLCAAATPPKAALPETVTTSRGQAIFDYSALGCSGTDTVTASLAPVSSEVATGEIEFVAATTPAPRLGVKVTAEGADEDAPALETLPILGKATLHVTLTDAGDSPKPSQNVVLFLVGDNIEPESPSVVTDAAGKATARLIATPASDRHRRAVVAVSNSKDLGQATVAADVELDLEAAPVKLGYFDGKGFQEEKIGVGSPKLGRQGATKLDLMVFGADDEPVRDEAIRIQLRSLCSRRHPPRAMLLPDDLTTLRGHAIADYKAEDCDEPEADIVTASLEPISPAEATGKIEFTDQFVVPTIEFARLTHDHLFLSGTGDSFGNGGGRPEKSEVVFTVSHVGAIDDEPPAVEFSLTSDLTGLALVDADGNEWHPDHRATPDEDGVVSIFVRAGPLADSTRVRAAIEVDGIRYSALSDEILVSSWIPDQNSMSLTAPVSNVAGGDTDGLKVPVTVRLADHFNNPVLDGTTVNFTTEYGAIDAFCRTGVAQTQDCKPAEGGGMGVPGQCCVLWSSQEPRQSLNYAHLTPTVENTACPNTGWKGPCPEPLHPLFLGGRSTILATASGGEESFVDSDGDGRYSAREKWDDLPEAFIDHNEDEVFNPAVNPCKGVADADCASGMEEEFQDFDGNAAYSKGDKRYNGSLCPAELDGRDCQRMPVTVRQDLVLVMSSSDQRLLIANRNGEFEFNGTLEHGYYQLHIADLYNNPPPGGSQLQIDAGECPVSPASVTRIGASGKPGAWTVDVLMEETQGDEHYDTIDFTLTLPDGRVVQFPPRDCQYKKEKEKEEEEDGSGS